MVTHDPGTNFSSREFASNCDLLHIRLDPVPKEAPQSMTTVERQHASLRSSFQAISRLSPPTAAEQTDASMFYQFDDLLQMTYMAFNDGVDPDGLVPTLLVYGAMSHPRVALVQSHPTTIVRAHAARRATEELTIKSALRQTRSSLWSRNTPDVLVPVHLCWAPWL